MRTIEIKLYHYDELPTDQAKAKARAWYLRGIEEDFSDLYGQDVIDRINEAAQILGIQINTRAVKLMNGSTRHEPAVYWTLGGPDTGVQFDGAYRHNPAAREEIRKMFPGPPSLDRSLALYEIADRLHQIGGADARIEAPHNSIGVRVWPDDDDFEAEVIRVAVQIDAFCKWVLGELQAEYEYQTSEEALEDGLRANEYEFTEDGKVQP